MKYKYVYYNSIQKNLHENIFYGSIVLEMEQWNMTVIHNNNNHQSVI